MCFERSQEHVPVFKGGTANGHSAIIQRFEQADRSFLKYLQDLNVVDRTEILITAYGCERDRAIPIHSKIDR